MTTPIHNRRNILRRFGAGLSALAAQSPAPGVAAGRRPNIPLNLLEAVGLKPEPDRQLDGISIVPALQGHKLKHEAIFCHFPHYTTLTGIGPAWARTGDWKLIRRHCDTDKQADRFEPYNLGKDLSEITAAPRQAVIRRPPQRHRPDAVRTRAS